MEQLYKKNLTQYYRRKTWEVPIGHLALGGNNPIRIQSMTNTFTSDTEKTVAQCLRMIDAGCEYIRMATPSIKEAENLKNIKDSLRRKGCQIPLIADVHFNPKVAEIAAEIVEKVRINQGNYVDKKTVTPLDYSDKEYVLEIERISERLLPLLKICQRNGTAIRIGTNHGSLSDRIVNRYGNSPLGMAMSAMEYVQICNTFGFHNLVLSMKSSDTQIMVQSVRLLVKMLDEKKWYYPLHLGVTEAGNGEYGRIKSAAGIGSLLQDGIGDTIRISLTESPENELPFAKIIANLFTHSGIEPQEETHLSYNPYLYEKRKSFTINCVGGNYKPVIFSTAKNIEKEDKNPEKEDYFTLKNPSENFPDNKLLVLESNEQTSVIAWRKLFAEKITNPLVFKRIYKQSDWEKFYAQATTDVATLGIDGLIDGIWIENPHFSSEQCYQLSLKILQACKMRYSTAEFISCPSCGRTQYKIEEFLEKIKKQTSHLKGLKIAVMGCIVNGPGEMSDADYGFIGSGNGKVSLYKGQTLKYQNIPESEAVDKLIELIKENGDW